MTIESVSRPRGDARAITIAILAMGGEGGGVLGDWLIDLAEHEGWIAQVTSVPGVAQRTGATIYYVELFPGDAAAQAGCEPVLALMPTPGEVDVVIASELMEAGRAIQRGLVTPDRTTLLASTHRVYSMTEKMAMGDGRVDSERLMVASRDAARRMVSADFARIAEEASSVIGAALFGGLAASGALPFPRARFEEAIRRGGIGVGSSLKAFAAGFDAALATTSAATASGSSASGSSASGISASGVAPGARASSAGERAASATALGPRLREHDRRITSDFPVAAGEMLRTGVLRLADWQDERWAAEYLDRLALVAAIDESAAAQVSDAGGHAVESPHALLVETARHLALWMSYEDTVRVADLKTRATRFERVGREVRHREGTQLLAFSEYMHPRVEEIAETLPAGIGRWLLRTGWARGLLGRYTSRGRRVRTSSLGGYLLLRSVAGLRRIRRSSLRFEVERARIDAWLAQILLIAKTDPRLALEVARCQRLVKGYGDTHARGWRSFERLMASLDRIVGQPDPAVMLSRLRDAALADDEGHALDAALARL